MPKFIHRVRHSFDLAKDFPKKLKERIARKPAPTSNTKGKQPEIPLPGFLRLSVEIRLKIYGHLFTGFDLESQHGYAANRSPYRLQSLDPFMHPGSGLILTSRQLLNEVADFLYINSRLSFARQSQALLFLNLTRPHLNQLSYLDLTVPAFETRDLEPIFQLLIESDVPLRSLFLRLTPSFPGRISYPVPMYMIPRYAYELPPIHNHLYTSSPRFPYVRTHSVAAIESASSSNSWMGKLKGVRCLKVMGQPEFDRHFELGVLKLYLGMVELAKEQGQEVVLSKDNGSKGVDFYFEAWIAPSTADVPS